MGEATTKTAIVTGAAGGVARALLPMLIGEGYRVALIDINAIGLGKIATDLGERLPRLSQGVSGPQSTLEPVTVLTCSVVVHEADPSPGSCLKSPDHPPFPGTPPLRSTPVQGHHRPKELPWLTTRGTA